MKRKINILHTVLSMDVGGLEKLVSEMSLMMNHDLFNVEICCFDQLGKFSKRLQKNGIKITLLQKNQNHFDLFYPLRLAKFLRKNRIDVLHMHSGTFFFGCLASWLARTPATIFTDHGRALEEPKIRAIEDYISGIIVDSIVAVSGELKEFLIDRIKLPARKICTIINGIKVSDFRKRPKPTRLVKEFQIADSCKIIGTVGRLDGIKDQLSIIKAFELIKESIPNCRLFIIGDGPLKTLLREYITQHQLGDSVTLPGERSDISDMLNLFDLFVLSSLSEGTSIALLEAMASGLPSVVTNVGGNPSIIKNNVNGFLIHPRDINEMSDKIFTLLNDDVLYNRISDNAITTVFQEFNIVRTIEAYSEIYLQLLIGKRKYRDIE